MPKIYTSIKVTKELRKKIIRARGKLEQKTGERYTIASVIERGIDNILSTA